MKRLITLLALSWTALAAAQTADQFVASGRSALAQTNWWGADTNFTSALAVAPVNANANALKAMTRLLVLPQTPAGSNFLVALGFPKTNRYQPGFPMGGLPKGANGGPIFPANYNSATVVSFIRTSVLAVITNSSANLAAITDPNYTLALSSSETLVEPVTVDYGDIQMLRALLASAQFFCYTLNANNCSVVLPQVETAMQSDTLTYQWLLATYPSLLTLANPGDLAPSKGALTNAIALYFAASDFIRHVRPAATNRLFNWDPDDEANVAKEAKFRTTLTNVLLSLNAPVEFSPDNANALESTACLGAWFAGTHSLRSLMPRFNGDIYINNSLPNYTFGGILPYIPAYKTEAMLRKEFYSYAGIYLGEFSGPSLDGVYSVFVGTDQKATVLGYSADQMLGLFLTFPIEDDGYWQIETNGDSGFGYVHRDGTIEGEFDSPPGNWVASLWGSRQSELGFFQDQAGFYSGTWSFAGGSGNLQGVLAADGQFYYGTFMSGEQIDGGSGQFDTGNHLNSVSASELTVTGTLNRSTRQVTGSLAYPGYSDGSFSLSRSVSVPFDYPPAITKDLLLSTNVVLGTNVAFSITATGSPPMSYQWYFNGNAIPGAMTNTLVVSNNLWTSTGTYTVLATVNNVSSGTNSQICTVNVGPEPFPPTVAITNITSGMLVSNAAFMVMGRAGDNVAVSDVLVSVNSTTGFAPASKANNGANWSAPVTLAAGTNTIRACSVNTSGIHSITNSANIVYVVSAALTVWTNGIGVITPGYNGTLLQLGTAYTMTASPGSGFVFTNWMGGTGLPLAWLTNGTTVRFLMQSNLVLQANFLDITKPTLSITNLSAGQRVSNNVFTVRGTAGDNWQVSNVAYQLNGGTWSNAPTANNWTNWWGNVNLLPGTNVVLAFAVDSTGSSSATNSVSFQFVVTNLLGVRSTGLGTLSPNYSNSWLEVGRNYTMTAAPGSGFVVTNWVISTNWTGGRITNNAAVIFMMASNLTLQVNFLDITKPTLAVSSPTAGQRMTNALANLAGIASDNWKVASVWYQLNSNVWSLVNTTNGYTNWNKTVTLLAGTNSLNVYAQDLGGNYSATNSISVVSSNAFKLQLAFAVGQPLAGNGLNFVLQISPGLSGRVQASTNLADWMTLTNFAGTNATINFRDATATNYNQRFYRAVIP